MVAKTPPKQKTMDPALNPILIRQTVQKVDRCMARLQELQFRIASGNKLICRESLRSRNGTSMIYPVGKFPPKGKGEWKRMSLQAMILGETVGEILQATEFTKQTLPPSTNTNDPKTPSTQRNHDSPNPKYTQLDARRRREKQQQRSHSIRFQNPNSPTHRRARSKINFKTSPSPSYKKERNGNIATPSKKALFHSIPSSNHTRFCKTGSPVGGIRQPPHKFLIKTPVLNSKYRVKIRSPRSTSEKKQSRNCSPMVWSAASKLKRCLSPARFAYKLVSPSRNKNCINKYGLKPPPPLMPLPRMI